MKAAPGRLGGQAFPALQLASGRSRSTRWVMPWDAGLPGAPARSRSVKTGFLTKESPAGPSRSGVTLPGVTLGGFLSVVVPFSFIEKTPFPVGQSALNT
jgi:hypothetical protein